MLQLLLDVALGLSSAVCGWGWEHAQHLEERSWGLRVRNVSIWGETRLQDSAENFSPWKLWGLLNLWGFVSTRKMTGIHCANCVQMWGWVSRITHILSCLHECLQTISNFQIALSFFFSCRSGGNCGQISMLPGWWRRTLLGKEVFSCLVPTEGMEEEGERGESTAHPVLWVHTIPLWWMSFPAAPGLDSHMCP